MLTPRARIMEARRLLGEAEQALDNDNSHAMYLVCEACHDLAPLVPAPLRKVG